MVGFGGLRDPIAGTLIAFRYFIVCCAIQSTTTESRFTGLWHDIVLVGLESKNGYSSDQFGTGPEPLLVLVLH